MKGLEKIKMKKVLAWFTVILTMIFCGCEYSPVEKVISPENQMPMFVEIEHTSLWLVVYHRETNVMYVISDGDYNHGNFTLLVNADGTPMIYDGEKGDEGDV